MPVILWIVLAIWDAVIVYVVVNIRSVMADNNTRIAKLFGSSPSDVTDRSVLINRILLAVLLAVSNLAMLCLRRKHCFLTRAASCGWENDNGPENRM